jgi:hypothetical protein
VAVVSELDTRIKALAGERDRPDAGERMAEAAPYDAVADLDRLIGVLAGAMLSRAPHGHETARDGRAAEYARLRAAGFSREQAAEEVRVYSRTTIGRYEHLRDQGVA